MIQYSSQLFCYLLLFLPYSSWSQDFSSFSVPVLQNGQLLEHAWLGGLNAPQVSQIDLNQDGFMDLHIFDRQGNVQLTFLHSGTPGTAQYTYAPSYLEAFPEISNWMMLRDYNADGVMDILCYSDIPGVDGLIAYTGSYLDGQLHFERYDFGPPFNMASFPSNNGNLIPIYISKIDYPGIADVDCDGDLDLLTFNISGGYVEWYRNTSVEQGHGLERLEFVLEDGCWGGFYESGITTQIDLAAAPGQCYTPDNGALAVNYRHTGSTLMPFDPDGDGDLDLVLGDLSFNQLVHLQNGGDCTQAWMNQQDLQFPNPEYPLDLPSFPVSFYLDVDQDGQEDLLAAPNSLQNAEDRSVLWYYQGNRSEAKTLPQFTFQQNKFLVGDMLDFGTNAYPAFFDYNNDGKMDLVIGNQSRFSSEGHIQSSLFLYENTGSPTQAAYQLVDEDYLGMQQFNPTSYGFRPTFGDLDGDGDQDILIGEAFGYLYYGENTAGPNAPAVFAPLRFQYMDIDVGLSSAPVIVDVNQDGLQDILVGERQGNINYFMNTGSLGSPQFLADVNAGGNVNRLAEISTRAAGFLIGNSSPLVFYQNDQAYLMLGSEQGAIQLYRSSDRRLDGELLLIDEQVGNYRAGRGSSAALTDMDQDGFLEMLVGNARGGLQLNNTPFLATTSVNTQKFDQRGPAFTVYPNPAAAWVSLETADISENWQLEVRQVSGQLIHQQGLTRQVSKIDVAHWSPGVYLFHLKSKEGSTVRKLIKK